MVTAAGRGGGCDAALGWVDGGLGSVGDVIGRGGLVGLVCCGVGGGGCVGGASAWVPVGSVSGVGGESGRACGGLDCGACGLYCEALGFGDGGGGACGAAPAALLAGAGAAGCAGAGCGCAGAGGCFSGGGGEWACDGDSGRDGSAWVRWWCRSGVWWCWDAFWR